MLQYYVCESSISYFLIDSFSGISSEVYLRKSLLYECLMNVHSQIGKKISCWDSENQLNIFHCTNHRFLLFLLDRI